MTSVLGRRDGWEAGRIDGWMDGWIDDEGYVWALCVRCCDVLLVRTYFAVRLCMECSGVCVCPCARVSPSLTSHELVWA